MPQRISKNSKKKYGLTPGYVPKLLREPTETATISIWQKDGTIRYVTPEDFKWLVNNKTIDSSILTDPPLPK